MKALICAWPLPGQPNTHLPGAGLAGKPKPGLEPSRGQRPRATPMGLYETLLDTVRPLPVGAAVVVSYAAANGPGAAERATALRPHGSQLACYGAVARRHSRCPGSVSSRAAILSLLSSCSQ